MRTAHLRIEEIDGWHDDDWCNQLVRVRVTAERQSSELSGEIWLPPIEAQGERCVATLTVENAAPVLFSIERDAPTQIRAPVSLAAGQEISFRIFCSNRYESAGDARQLSFVLCELGFQ